VQLFGGWGLVGFVVLVGGLVGGAVGNGMGEDGL